MAANKIFFCLCANQTNYCSLVLMEHFFCILSVLTRLVSLISTKTKEYFFGPRLCIRSIRTWLLKQWAKPRKWLNISEGIAFRFRRICSENIVESIGKVLNFSVTENDISVADPLPSYKKDALLKLIVKFTRTNVRNEFYAKRKVLAGKNLLAYSNVCSRIARNI